VKSLYVLMAAWPVLCLANEDSILQFSLSHPSTAVEAYAESRGSGLIRGNPSTDDSFVFAVQLPEGSYRVGVDLLPAEDPQPVTIKSESRRLMVENHVPPSGKADHFTFNVNIRTPKLKAGGSVQLNDREIGVWHWDDRLELEIHARPGTVGTISIEPARDVVTVYLAGDSTVTDQPEEPWIGWGQMLPRFFGPEVVVANHAESGLALSSFFAHHRIDKILENIRPGDYLFIQFGHNDQKERGEGIGPWESYRDYLLAVIKIARKIGAKPVLITSMQRRRFDDECRQFATLGDYPLVMRRVAAESGVPLIDLNQMSATLYAALGPEGTIKAFVHYPAGSFPGQDKPIKDDTHFNPYGGYELARCVVEGIRLEVPALARYLDPDVPPFDPASPDPFEAVNIPPSGGASFEKPLGN